MRCATCSAALVAAIIAVGCGDSNAGGSAPLAPTSTTSPAASEKGTVVLRFAVAAGARKSAALRDPLRGSIYGALYLAEDVGATGPREGAPEFGSIEVADVDLEKDEPSTATWTSEPLDPNTYIFTGFMDLDENGKESKRPDVGDPATVPFKDKTFVIESAKQIEFVEKFDIILN